MPFTNPIGYRHFIRKHTKLYYLLIITFQARLRKTLQSTTEG